MIDVQVSVELSYAIALLWAAVALSAIGGQSFLAGCFATKRRWRCLALSAIDVMMWAMILVGSLWNLTRWYSALAEARGW